MEEIEVKILDIDREDVERKLQEFGARKISEKILTDTRYDTPDETLHAVNKMLRIRNDGNEVRITAKGPKMNGAKAKIREEIELIVSNEEEAAKLFHILGFVESGVMRKRRISYVFGPLHIEIDKHVGDYKFIPEYLEIEGPSESAILAFAAKLGFAEEDCLPLSVRQLVKRYRRD